RARAAHQALRAEPGGVDRRARGRPAEPADRHDVVGDAGRIREAALRQPPLDRHLAALEPHRNLAARARLVALVAAPGGAAHAGGRALAAALRRPGRAGGRMDVAESDRAHAGPTSSTFTRCRTLNSMPRIWGVSWCSTVCCMRRIP